MIKKYINILLHKLGLIKNPETKKELLQKIVQLQDTIVKLLAVKEETSETENKEPKGKRSRRYRQPKKQA